MTCIIHRHKSALVTDKRIQIMNEIITGIKVIKMYAWEYAFKAVVSKLRRSGCGLLVRAHLSSLFVTKSLVQSV